MKRALITRRTLLATSGATVLTTAGLMVPAHAAGIAPTATMRGGVQQLSPRCAHC